VILMVGSVCFFFNALTLLAELSSRNAIWSDINEILLFPKFV